MSRIRFARPARETAWPWWILFLSGILVALLAVTLLVGALGGYRSPKASASPATGGPGAACGAHIAQASAAASSGAGLVFAGCIYRNPGFD